MVPIILEPIKEGMHVVLSRYAAANGRTQRRRVGLVTKVDRKSSYVASEVSETFTVEILEPNRSECTCLLKKKHRVNHTTGDQVCTDSYGENRHGHHRIESPKVLTLEREDFWKLQEFLDE
jgi:hypothetical protein